MKNSIVILAAGLGTRMRSSIPKVLQKICGKSMVLHILEKASALSDDMSVVLSRQEERVEKEVCKFFPQTKFTEQDLVHFPGTVGALKDYKAQDKGVLVPCGGVPLIKLQSLKALLELGSDLALAVLEAKDTKSYGRVMLEGSEAQKIVELEDADEKEKMIKTCSAGVYMVNTKLLSELLPLIGSESKAKGCYLANTIKLARAKNTHIKPLFVGEEEFMDVNDKFELSTAESLMQDKIRKFWQKEGVILRSPSSIFIGLDVKFIGEYELYKNVRIEGKSVMENSIIRDSNVIEDSKISFSNIGPLAHLHPKCELENTHIGNFVECKNAKLSGVKTGHLSYLGDCEIGEGTNMGYGTTTCNYSGVKRHKTITGKDAFVGSGTQFIAPVYIEDEVIIAAGSSVSENVPKDSLFINRAQSKILKNYFYKKFQ